MSGKHHNYYTSDNEILRVALRKQCIRERLDDIITVNAAGRLVETANSGNLFIIKDNTIYTPPLADGCRADVMRRVILEKVAPALGYETMSDKPLYAEDINTKVDEMFVASTRTGIPITTSLSGAFTAAGMCRAAWWPGSRARAFRCWSTRSSGPWA